ncbi:MAG: hypothetical protein FD189_152 [Elusimicrobia bacterium]|nr:MAG: hypothetical protein FD154_304 [Elusimicrobiota bacterium]KAF0158160.1 MAG: hypothetical protein FD189_152 [Elusimicrobiota bacterium]
MDDSKVLCGRCRELLKSAARLRDDFDACYQYTWFRFSPFNPDYARWKKDVRDQLVRAFGANSSRVTELDRCERVYSQSAPGTLFDHYLDSLKSAVAALEAVPLRPQAAPAASAGDTIPHGVPVPSDRVSFRAISRDLLARAAELREEGNFLSAAVMCGAVLENALRRICESENLPPQAKALDLPGLCETLLARGALDREEHRQLMLKFSLKKLAEHCYSEKLNSDNVGEMIEWTGGFLDRRFH